MQGATDVAVSLCETCAAADGGALAPGFAADLQAALGPELRVRQVPCMNRCAAPLALALQGAGRVSYLFDGVDPAIDVEATVALVRLYAAAPGGEITDARPAGRLRTRLVGRLPAL